MHSSLVQLSLCFTLYFSAVLSFSVTIGSSPTQCGPLNITWTGGRTPFQILLTPVFGVPRNISVPSTAFDNNLGSYQLSALPFTNNSTFLLTMSDATGFGTGGTSDLLTVGAPVAGASCNTTNPSLPFSFSLPSSLQQCNPYVFDGYDRATLPVTCMGLIPGGDSFLLYSASTSVTWVADVAAGTTIVFAMTDAQGRTGGSSDTEMVALSNDASCLYASSPSSTMSATPSSTSTAGSSTRSSSSVSTGTIVGIAFGVMLAVIAIVALAVFYLKRSRHRRSPYGLASARNSGRSNSVELETDNFQHPQIYPFPYQTDSASHLAPPMIPNSSAIPASHQETSSMDGSNRASEMPTSYTRQHSRTPSNNDSFAAYGDIASSSMSSGRRKAAMTGLTSYLPVARFVVHADAEDYVPEGEAEVIELPPQYSERRPAATRTEEEPRSASTGLPSTHLPSSGQNVGVSPDHTSHPPPRQYR